MTMKSSTSLLVLAALVSGACGAPDKKSESPFAPAPDPNDGPPVNRIVQKPWTDRFFTTGALIARDVRVEGPDGLLEHVVATQDLSRMDVAQKTTPDGLLQVITLHQVGEGEELRAQLDNLAIVCTRSLTILERPGPVSVVVVASGDAFLQEKGAPEQRGQTLRIEGQVKR
jgi:hypothetical protein